MRPKYEIADIIDRFYDEDFRRRIPVHQQRTLRAVRICRTAELGGHVDECDSCGYTRISFNSCRNRHCPKCQGLQKEMWTIQREEELLPIAYFHVVFTLPHELNGLCLLNPKFMYNLLFESAWYVINTFSRDKKWLGAQSAATMLLHTWGQNLSLHPHVHCIVPNGGINKNGDWQNSHRGNAKFLFPILAMNKVYKAYFLKRMRVQLEAGSLSLPEGFPKHSFYKNWKETLYKKEWVIYAKPPFGGVKNVVKYLARYSHRSAISNRRIVAVDNHHVKFIYKDYKVGGEKKVMTLNGRHFLQRFCLHILPNGFRRIRHYGFLSNAAKGKRLNQARKALLNKVSIAMSKEQRKVMAIKRIFGHAANLCPCCKQGQMNIIDVISPNKDPPIVQVYVA